MNVPKGAVKVKEYLLIALQEVVIILMEKLNRLSTIDQMARAIMSFVSAFGVCL